MIVSTSKSKKLDFILEIGNIGSGNALTSLSRFINRRVDMNTPIMNVLDYEELLKNVGGSENIVSGFLITIEGDIDGIMLFLLQQDLASEVCDILLGDKLVDFTEMGDMEKSLFQEIANIMSASYVNALADLSQMKINISTPSLAVDMAGAILSVPLVHFENLFDEVMFIQNTFVIDAQDYNSSILFFLDDKSVKRLMNKLGVEQ